jgi:hypothetical protein
MPRPPKASPPIVMPFVAPPPPYQHWGTVLNLLIIPIISAALSLAGWYYVSQAAIARHEEAISITLPKAIERLAEGLSSLNIHVAVQDEQNKQINNSLDRISGQLLQLPKSK